MARRNRVGQEDARLPIQIAACRLDPAGASGTASAGRTNPGTAVIGGEAVHGLGAMFAPGECPDGGPGAGCVQGFAVQLEESVAQQRGVGIHDAPAGHLEEGERTTIKNGAGHRSAAPDESGEELLAELAYSKPGVEAIRWHRAPRGLSFLAPSCSRPMAVPRPRSNHVASG